MKKNCLALCFLLILPVSLTAAPFVDIQTNQGTITIELLPEEAPVTVANFLNYADTGFYDNTLFHRVVNDFVIQGGGLGLDSTIKDTLPSIELESNNGLSNQRGTIAMARTSAPDSASSQFFINSVNNDFLDYQNSNNLGYAVFGFVIEGLDVVDSINKVKTDVGDVPREQVIIETIRRREGQLSLTKVEETYSTGDIIELSLDELDFKRKISLDLWVAIVLPNGELLFLTQENEGFFSKSAIPFKRAVSIEENNHQILSFTISSGLSGHYTFLAIFNDLNADLSDLTHSMRSNFVRTEIDIVE